MWLRGSNRCQPILIVSTPCNCVYFCCGPTVRDGPTGQSIWLCCGLKKKKSRQKRVTAHGVTFSTGKWCHKLCDRLSFQTKTKSKSSSSGHYQNCITNGTQIVDFLGQRYFRFFFDNDIGVTPFAESPLKTTMSILLWLRMSSFSILCHN